MSKKTGPGSRSGRRGQPSLPKGLDKLSRKADEGLGEEADGITESLLTNAKHGGTTSAKLLFDMAKLQIGRSEPQEEEAPVCLKLSEVLRRQLLLPAPGAPQVEVQTTPDTQPAKALVRRS